MEKLVGIAFEKLQKRELLLRAVRNRMALGHMTREEFKKEEAAIIERFELTNEEQRAYERHTRMQEQMKHKKQKRN